MHLRVRRARTSLNQQPQSSSEGVNPQAFLFIHGHPTGNANLEWIMS